MRANKERIRVVDRVALGATFGATMLIVAMFGLTVTAPAQTARVAGDAPRSFATPAHIPTHCQSVARDPDRSGKG